jgi:hypothetical protein
MFAKRTNAAIGKNNSLALIRQMKRITTLAQEKGIELKLLWEEGGALRKEVDRPVKGSQLERDHNKRIQGTLTFKIASAVAEEMSINRFPLMGLSEE